MQSEINIKANQFMIGGDDIVKSMYIGHLHRVNWTDRQSHSMENWSNLSLNERQTKFSCLMKTDRDKWSDVT